MRESLPFKNLIYLSFILNLVVSLAVVILKNFLPPVAPLFYGLPVGSAQLVPTLGLIVAPFTSLLITCGNLALTKFTKDEFLTKTLIVSSAFVSVLMTITVVKIILLVGFF